MPAAVPGSTVDGVSKSEHLALYEKVQQIFVLLNQQKESGQQVQAGMLSKTDVETIVRVMLDKEMAGVAAAAGSQREADLADQVVELLMYTCIAEIPYSFQSYAVLMQKFLGSDPVFLAPCNEYFS